MTVRVDIPIDIGRDDARRAAERELSRTDYSAGDPPLPVQALSGLEMLARQFARELAPHRIRANIVPLGERQTADQVADAVTVLCSPAVDGCQSRPTEKVASVSARE